MTTVLDVAALIVRKQGPMSAMKLQKLVYYCQVWSLVWDDKPLFRARIEAWANGPVTRRLYREHRGQFEVRGINGGNPAALDANQKGTVETVLDFYGDKSPQWLSDLTHMEEPWRAARKGLAPGEHGEREITLESMGEYYGSL